MVNEKIGFEIHMEHQYTLLNSDLNKETWILNQRAYQQYWEMKNRVALDLRVEPCCRDKGRCNGEGFLHMQEVSLAGCLKWGSRWSSHKITPLNGYKRSTWRRWSWGISHASSWFSGIGGKKEKVVEKDFLLECLRKEEGLIDWRDGSSNQKISWVLHANPIMLQSF